jgi:hypothetical protein
MKDAMSHSRHRTDVLVTNFAAANVIVQEMEHRSEILLYTDM